MTTDLDRVLPSADAVYLLRMQLERQGQALVPSLREYTSRFGLTRARLERLGDKTAILHPGPMNRGVEIAPEAAETPRSLILDQVAAGVAVRMAVLFDVLGADDRSDSGDRANASEPGSGGVWVARRRSPSTARWWPMADHSDVVLKGGRVLDASGERAADVVIGPDGFIVAVGTA